MRGIILTVFVVFLYSCNSGKEKINYGTFKLYEDDTLVGTIYRIDNFQIEKYLDESEVVAKIQYTSDSTYIMSGIEKNQVGIDTLKWLNTYRKTGNSKFQIIAKPQNSDIDYEYKATLVKTRNEVPIEFAERLNELNE
ncbi:hypothetical protein EAX61_05290 [Dokdonia sinensis]|uniref:Uncharacterized protein n=1 Tax=Dokdonia sinensis TaxID=2479847 RepID=A0A3M0GIG5_9FLAO|nr:hypothetical protein [Dokdonia sinensis]RMB60899.1 hypothetical protein EAX61_05290 [Dokdonia sinensis]